MKVYGLNIGWSDTGAVLSKSTTKIWADEVCETTRWGFFFRLVFGEWLRPIGKIWKLGWWRREPEYNAWESGNHWFVFRSHIPLPGLLFSCFVGKRYFYAGTKTYGIDREKYAGWLDKKLIKDGNQALAPSGSIKGF